jgi:hypothetical protein
MKRSLSVAVFAAVLLAGCSQASAPGGAGPTVSPESDPIGQADNYDIDPATDPQTVAACKALDIGSEVHSLMGQATLLPRLNKADNVMCAFATESTKSRSLPELLLVTLTYKDGAKSFEILYPEVRPGGLPWGKSDLGDNAKWWVKDPKVNGEYGSGLGILTGTTFVQISSSSPEKSTIVDQPQTKYEDLGQKILDGPYAKADPRASS